MSLTHKSYDKKELQTAELSVISSIVYHYENVVELATIEEIPVKIFQTPEAKLIFKTLLNVEIQREKFDALLIQNELKNLCSDEETLQKCEKYFEKLTKNIQYYNFEKHLQILQENAVKKELDNLSQEIIGTSLSSKNFDDVIQKWEKDFLDATLQNKSINFITAEAAVKEYDNLSLNPEKEKGYLKTGFSNLDQKIKGLKKGQLIVVASRPGVGKTTFALNIINNNLANLKKNNDNKSQSTTVGVFSLEMNNVSLIEKLVAINSKIKLKTLQNLMENKGADKCDIEISKASKNKISDANILFCDHSNITLGKIIATIKLWTRQYDLKFVIIDYLQLINLPNEKETSNFNQYQKIGMISRQLKVLSLQLDICIVTLAQLNRKSEDRKSIDKSPILSDLRESGSIEQDADVVMFLYPEVRMNQTEVDDPNLSSITLKIGKNRHGPTGSVYFQFKKDIGSFAIDNETTSAIEE